MSEEDNNEIIASIAKGTAEGLGNTTIVKNLLEPASKNLGQALGTLTGAINVALAPVAGIVWGYDKISEWLTSELNELLKNTPSENIITPKVSIVGPAIEALKFMGEESELRKLFAQLIATSINSETEKFAHNAFVDVIKSLSTDDALTLLWFKELKRLKYIDVFAKGVVTGENIPNGANKIIRSKCFHTGITIDGVGRIKMSTLDNLIRLGLLQRVSSPGIDVESPDFDKLLIGKSITEYIAFEQGQGNITEVVKGYFRLTAFGFQFCKACT